MAEIGIYGTNERNTPVNYREPELGKVAYGSEEDLLELAEEKKEHCSGVILAKYDGLINVTDGTYEIGTHYVSEINKVMSGYFGRVYPCIDKKNRADGTFVTKIVDLTDKFKSEKERKKVNLREVKALLHCKHENIVKLIGLIVKQNNIEILMENGGDPIRGKLQEQPEPVLLLTWFRQLFSGLSCIHEKGFVHCDLHLGNLLVNHQKVLKICDLGSAKRINERLFTISHGYTVWYFPPTVLKLYFERKQQEKVKADSPEEVELFLENQQIQVRPRLDLYSTGKLLLEITCGREGRPIVTEELEDAIKSERMWNYFLRETIPKQCNTMIEYLITNLMTYHTTDIFETAEQAAEYIEIRHKMQRMARTVPQPPFASIFLERNRRESQEEPMDTN